MEQQRRAAGRIIDTQRLDAIQNRVYLHRFVDAVRNSRGAKGRYLYLRAGDELAIVAAEDGSAALLDRVTVIDTLREEDADNS